MEVSIVSALGILSITSHPRNRVGRREVPPHWPQLLHTLSTEAPRQQNFCVLRFTASSSAIPSHFISLRRDTQHPAGIVERLMIAQKHQNVAHLQGKSAT
jgi:hypothetical protein